MEEYRPGADLEVRLKSIVVERLKLAGVTRISNEVLDNLTVSAFPDAMGVAMDQTAIQLSTRILAHDQGVVTVTFPATAWDHFKRDRLPRLGPLGRWYLRRHPVRESAKTLRRYAKFPGAEWAYPEGLGPVRIDTFETTDYEYE